MKELVEFTEDFKVYNPEEPFNEAVYYIVIIHDNAQEAIHKKFSFRFMDEDKNFVDKININDWKLKDVEIYDYYGRAKISLKICDPQGVNLPEIESGGFSLSGNESANISYVVNRMESELQKVRRISLFKDYRSRLDYINIMKENDDINSWNL
mgnify:CR=1 FL=1